MTTTTCDLIEAFQSLTSDQQRTLRTLLVWHDERAGWLVRCSYASLRHPGGEVKSGATVAGTRAADTEHRLSLGAEDPHADLVAMCRALVAVAAVGSLEVVRYAAIMPDGVPDYGFPTWMVHTHAGSDRERAAWLRGLSGGGIPPVRTRQRRLDDRRSYDTSNG